MCVYIYIYIDIDDRFSLLGLCSPFSSGFDLGHVALRKPTDRPAWAQRGNLACFRIVSFFA